MTLIIKVFSLQCVVGTYVFINCYGFSQITLFVSWEISQITNSVVWEIFQFVMFP